MSSILPYSLYIDNGTHPLDPNAQSFGSVVGNAKAQLSYIERIDSYLSDRGLRPSRQARYSSMRAIVLRAFEGIFPADSKGWNTLQTALADLCQITAVISTHSHLDHIPKDLRAAFFKDAPDIGAAANTPGRDFLFQYFCAARLAAAGCQVRDGEPDLVCNYKGLEFGVAAKRSVLSKLDSNIRDARVQISKTFGYGMIFVDLSKDSPVRKALPLGSLDEYRQAVNKWLSNHFLDHIRLNSSKLRLQTNQTPFLIGFHIGSFFTSNNTLGTVQTTSIFRMNPPADVAEMPRHELLFEVIEAIRRTLPGSS